MKILSVTTLYPNREAPTFGVFIENRLRHLAMSRAVDLRVVAPVPWFPSPSKRFGRLGALARVPAVELRHGIPISHPRYGHIPKAGMLAAPWLLYRCLLSHVRRHILPEFEPDLIDAHVYYPDGVAAALLAQALGKPVVVTARGTDLNLYPERYPLVRRLIAATARRVDASITVCQALAAPLMALGAPQERVHVLRNGVDLQTFQPQPRGAARRRFGIERPTLVSVGHLIERKGHHLVVEALARLPGVELVLAGDGPERARLQRLAESLGVRDRVRFLGVVGHEELATLYNAADLLVLASSREGWPNVLLEALACGTPVIATRNWGTPEIVTTPAAGRLVDQRSPDALAGAIRAMLAQPPDRAAVRRHAEQFSWQATTEGQLALFRHLLGHELRAAA